MAAATSASKRRSIIEDSIWFNPPEQLRARPIPPRSRFGPEGTSRSGLPADTMPTTPSSPIGTAEPRSGPPFGPGAAAQVTSTDTQSTNLLNKESFRGSSPWVTLGCSPWVLTTDLPFHLLFSPAGSIPSPAYRLSTTSGPGRSHECD